ncbi:uncharacterized protein BX664DRAFT_310073 [Halteromyces radiatus]|uniref:uncharacterized protein n=1 Tax=Halteromyces radiatus TaxID=101107 RepID=UPI00221F58FE|nr:uncharacterized protein BX664DRAFT_310073 [Halteromyces radiatus]KAI8099068.1 hypothetical protein BX664DRAFT_310073 [Halteromyces radiatus]
MVCRTFLFLSVICVALVNGVPVTKGTEDHSSTPSSAGTRLSARQDHGTSGLCNLPGISLVAAMTGLCSSTTTTGDSTGTLDGVVGPLGGDTGAVSGLTGSDQTAPAPAEQPSGATEAANGAGSTGQAGGAAAANGAPGP